MPNVTIKGDPRMGAAIAEGAATVELRAVKAECARLNALNGVRSYGDSVRYETACKALAVKYAVKPMGRVHGAILLVWACLWFGLYTLAEYLTREV